MKRLITSTLILITTIAALAGATTAFYADTETSTDNVFGATELDLLIRDHDEGYDGGVVATWNNNCGDNLNGVPLAECEDMKPGDKFEFIIPLVQLTDTIDSLDADHLEITPEYSVDETTNPVAGDTNPNTNATPDDFAKFMIITRMNYYAFGNFCINAITGQKFTSYNAATRQCAGTLIFQNNDWKIGRGNTTTSTFQDFKNEDGLDNLPPSSDVANFELSIEFDETAGNDLQGDIFSFDLIFTLNQEVSQ